VNCETCKFFQASGKFGMCQRYPEYVMKQAGMWCGEYQKKQEAIVDDREPKKRGRPPSDKAVA
jgi:hypothetical protein